jgi:hypothetical protein
MSNHAPHLWLRKISVGYTPGPSTPVLDNFATSLLECFRSLGHTVHDQPQEPLDILLTTAQFGVPMSWRKAALVTARKRYNLQHTPTVITLVQASSAQFQEALRRLENALSKEKPDPADFSYPGLEPSAYQPIYEQGLRGGPILAFERVLQAQAMCIRVILVVGDDTPREAYCFDLVGAHPRSDAADPEAFYTDLVLRIVTAVSTQEVAEHEASGEPIPAAVWESLSTPAAMQRGGLELGKRDFFTEMVSIADLVTVPILPDTVARQYSEGCFATWDPVLDALITTVTGSARPVSKYDLSDDDLAVLVGLRPQGGGARYQTVTGKRNDPPSSEAVEMVLMDEVLPRIRLSSEWGYGLAHSVPAARSKLHGHRGVRGFNPARVEYCSLDAPYFHYPVSCASEAQAIANRTAFGRSLALQNPSDPRQIAFTILPGHGVMIAEKWVAGKAPFQAIWEAMDNGDLEIMSQVPQGPIAFTADAHGRMVLKE